MPADEGRVPLRQFVEAILDEKDRALAMADDEREKAASALRGEQQRALDQAGREREKAAETLRIELARAIREGDERLREHISNQIMQIQAALVSAEKLEMERLSRSDAVTQALAEKLEVLRVAQSVAQDKFEVSVESRFSQVNEFRGALDDLGKSMATRRDLEASQAATNERYDGIQSAIGDLRSRLDIGPAGLGSLQSRVDLSAGHNAGAAASRTEGRASLAAAVGVLVLILAAVSLYLGTHRTTPVVVTPTVTEPAK